MILTTKSCNMHFNMTWWSYAQMLPIPEHNTQARCFWLEVDLEEGGKPRVPGEQPSSQVEIDRKLSPRRIVDVEYNANLTSPGTQHRDTRMVAYLDINPAWQDLTLVIKWEPVLSLMNKPYYLYRIVCISHQKQHWSWGHFTILIKLACI